MNRTRTRSRPRTRTLVAIILAVVIASSCAGADLSLGTNEDSVITPWTLASPMGSDTSHLPLIVSIGMTGCDELGDVEVAETSDHVTIRTHVVSTDWEGDCPADHHNDTITVELSEELGDRELRGCDPFDFDGDCEAVNRQRLDPANFGGDVSEFGEVDDPDFPPDDG